MLTKLLRAALYVSLLIATPCFAQNSRQDFQAAVDLYNKGMYAEAQQRITQLRKETPSTNQTQLANLDYYDIMCAVRLKQTNVVPLAERFLESYPESSHRSEVTLALALAAYNVENYKEAIKYFDAVKPASFDEVQKAEYYFKYGYCLLKTGKTDRAADLFAQVKDSSKSRYAPAATYYYAHIAYENKSYAAALKHFESIKEDPEFEAIVPFYMLQIYFHQKEYDKIIAQGSSVFANASSDRAAEVAKVLAEAHLQQKQYPQALEWFDKFRKTQKELSPNDSYLIAITYFNLEQYNSTIELLAKVKTGNDSVSQNIHYLLGAAYLKTNSKDKALASFEKAGKMTADKELAAEAQFNYAKLLFELKNDSSALMSYLEKYPSSKQQADIRSMLAIALFKEKKFQEAIDLIQQNPSPTESDNANLQKAAYYNALDLYKKGNFAEAKKNLNLSLTYAQYDASIAALATYWLGETYYRTENYANAKSTLTNYIKTATAFRNTPEYKMAHYTLAYCYFRESAYESASEWFKKFLTLSGSQETPFIADTHNRVGDCYFTKRQFTQAIESYGKALNLKLANPDYSLFQTALSEGMAGKGSKKKEVLDKLIAQYPQSSYVPAAWFELGKLHVQNTKYADAINSFEVITSKYTSSTYYPKALVELGLIKVNQNLDDEALALYKRVIEKYPNSAEAADALEGIKTIYMDKGSMSEYFNYTSTLGKGGYDSEKDKDSLVFTSAERLYFQDDCTRAVTALRNYLNEFPNGKSKLNASYYIGECLYREKDFVASLPYFSYVTSQPQNVYTEDALIRFAKASWELESYADAADAFARIEKETKQEQRITEAKTGAMRGYFLSKDYASSSNAATRLLSTTGLSSELIREARYIKARSLQQLHQLDEAKKAYEQLVKDTKTAEGAEANFRLAEILLAKGDYDKAEEAVMGFSESQTPYASWLARSFIVLGDVYVKKGDYSQARETYKSIVSNYKNKEDGVVGEVNERLKTIEGR